MLLAAGVIVGLVVLVSLLGDGDEAPPPTRRAVSIPGLGLGFSHPATWRRSIDRRVFRLRSPDGSAVITFSSPVQGRFPAAVKAAVQRTVRRRLTDARVVNEGVGRLGARRAITIEMAGRSDGRLTRVLAVVDSTPYRTYAVTVFTPAQPSTRTLGQVRSILNSVRLTEPVRSRAKR